MGDIIKNIDDAVNYIMDFDKAALKRAGYKKMSKIDRPEPLNMLYLKQIIARNLELAMSVIRPEGLDDTMDERIIQMSMIFNAGVLDFIKDGNRYAQPFNPLGGYNMNDQPLKAYVHSRNGIINQEVRLFVRGCDKSKLVNKTPMGTEEAKDKTGYIIWANKSRVPFIYTIMNYSYAMADTLRSIDTGRLWLKRPFIPVCEDNLVDSLYDMMQELKNNNDFIPMSTGTLDISRFTVLPLDGSGSNVNTLKALYEWYNQSFLAEVGFVTNTQADKKGENLTEDEIHMNDDVQDTRLTSQIAYWNKQAAEANKYLGGNLHFVDPMPKKETKEEKDDDTDVSGTDRQ